MLARRTRIIYRRGNLNVYENYWFTLFRRLLPGCFFIVPARLRAGFAIRIHPGRAGEGRRTGTFAGRDSLLRGRRREVVPGQR